MAYTLLFVADFGININGQLYDDDGTPNGAAITTGFVEVDSTSQPGVYSYKRRDWFLGLVTAAKAGGLPHPKESM